MDIALILDKIRPKADWGTATTYDDLKRTWRDEKQKIPTIGELEQAWNEILEEQSKSKEYEKIDQNILDTNEAIAAMHERLLKLEGGK
ncbi:MAG: hypothetical protein ACRC17_11445 [Culicoidibacterales bacterium]